MTRVFDVENEKDMADLWDGLQDRIIKLEKPYMNGYLYPKYVLARSEGGEYELPISINWHDKTEITRPMPECSEADIGKLCRFWNNDGLINAFGVLSNIYNGENDNYKMSYGGYWEHCRRLTKQEIEELC